MNTSCLARQATLAVRQRTIGSLSRPCSGFCVLAARGEICRRNLDDGTALICASPAGVTVVSGSVWPAFWEAMPTWSTCSSTPPLIAPINIPLAPKKSGESGDRPLAWRTDHQTACGRRCAGQSASGDSLGRTNRRYRPCLGTDQGSARSGGRGRQGVRRRSLRGENRSHWRRSGDSAPIQSPRTPPTSIAISTAIAI